MSSREQYIQAYHDWINALNNRDTQFVSNSVAEVAVHDGERIDKEQYVRRVFDILEASSVTKIELDTLIVDTTAQATAARLIHRGTLKIPYLGASVTGKPIEWSEYTLTWFNDDNKIVRTDNLVDVDALRAGTPEAPRTPSLTYSLPPMNFDIAAMYRGYLDTINAQTTKENLHKFVQPVVTHNLHVSNLDQYRLFIEDSFEQVEGMHLKLTDIIVDDVSQQIASRIELSGKPVGSWLGIPPTGRSMRFPEHAFYTLDGGKIAYLWAIRDFDTYKKCLEG
jgi:predicted ester cyclase